MTLYTIFSVGDGHSETTVFMQSMMGDDKQLDAQLFITTLNVVLPICGPREYKAHVGTLLESNGFNVTFSCQLCDILSYH